MRYLFGIFLVITLAYGQALSSTDTIFEDHKLRTYSPLKVGVKDLFFDIRMEGLLNNVKKTTSLTSLDDLYFRVYWTYPDQYRIVVEGLPKGFRMMRNNLRAVVKPYVDLIFSDDFIRQFEKVPFKQSSTDKKTYVKKKDKSTDVSDIQITFDSKGILNKIVSTSPYNKVDTEFDYKLRSWSNGKFVMNKIKIREAANGIVNNKEISIDRELQNGVGLPNSVTIEETLMRKEKVINSTTQKFTFSNYNVNTGKVKKIIESLVK